MQSKLFNFRFSYFVEFRKHFNPGFIYLLIIKTKEFIDKYRLIIYIDELGHNQISPKNFRLLRMLRFRRRLKRQIKIFDFFGI